jgi:hypothetical protein
MSMRGRRRQRRQVLAEAAADVECTGCGRRFEGLAAFQVHADGRCLPDGAYGQLVRLPDGRWSERWRHPEVRDG